MQALPSEPPERGVSSGGRDGRSLQVQRGEASDSLWSHSHGPFPSFEEEGLNVLLGQLASRTISVIALPAGASSQDSAL